MLAQWVVEHFPPHKVYIEPFFGGGAVLLTKPRCKVEIANDLDARIVNVYRMAVSQPELLAAALRVCPYHQGLAWNLGSEGIEAAVAAVAESRQKYATGAGSGWRPNLGSNVPGPVAWSRWWSRVAPLAQRIAGVCFYNTDACDVIEAHGNREGALIYADPPYLGHEREYAERVDYERLVSSLSKVSAAVVVSEYETAVHMYPSDWTTKVREIPRGKGRSTKHEVLILNPQAVERLGR